MRIEEDQDAQFELAAKSAGKSVSEWLRDLGAAAVTRAELDPIPRKITAADIAASIPGLRVGLNPGSPETATTDQASLAFVQSLLRYEEGDANEKLLERTQLPPSKFRAWFSDRLVQVRLAEWLNANHPELQW